MTGYTVNTGTSKKFVEGWDMVFGAQDSTEKEAKKKPPKASGTNKAAKKSAAKKKSGKKR